ncbi:hypothetical protein [Acidovorax sp. NB1]|uniref:hypothetical protein n=1 Tax=Acidovorax sp. NB1 TaxID=1943571 RepID=UPI0010E9F080|nr:hypothetical protein [Acidovorax sp. NB1]GDY37210.1 hypothetical protein ACINB_31020 [Acidovorax sp. NB1]
MMLLQAGQSGLYRRDSIWTDSIPPDSVSGGTLWIDGTDSNHLLDAWGGAPVTADGASVYAARNKLNTSNGMLETGFPPKLKVGAVNGLSALIFEGASASNMRADNGSAALPISTFFTTTTKVVVVGVKISSANPYTGSAFESDAIIADSDGYYGLYVTDDGVSGQVTLRGYNYGGDSHQITQSIAKNQWVIVTLSHQSSQLRMRVNRVAWTTLASGATFAMTALLRIASTGTPANRTMEIAHVAGFNQTQADAAISAIEGWMAGQLGISL